MAYEIYQCYWEVHADFAVWSNYWLLNTCARNSLIHSEERMSRQESERGTPSMSIIYFMHRVVDLKWMSSVERSGRKEL
ncbi:hypothetical protein KIN20_029906 [Parelaphostrongylus tenuis]|uniref:Uncharacterized protein n=1 Tax=Parelaphostrongylus tenuis TaxID=148309 RepID=A0AAD5R320_PARTN|nr:hypothetical protein KIN20_029906 [Parelaphostrongylus tenuis]